MVKAHIVTKDGTKIEIEGEKSEVADLIARFRGEEKRTDAAFKIDGRKRTRSGATPVSLISELIDGGYFKKPKELGAIKLALEEQGHFYPVTTLSPALLRLVRKKQLRRIKDKKRWLYVG